MRTYVIVLAILALTPTLVSASFGFEEYKQMFRGFLLGISVQEKHLTKLLSCLIDRKTLEVRFVEIMDKIDKLDFTNLPLTAQLFVELFDVITIGVVEIDLCAEANDEYDRLFRKIYHLMSTTIFKRLMLNFISNPQQIFKDIQDAVDNYILGKYQQLGNDLGDIMHMVLMYRGDAEAHLDYKAVVKGLLGGLGLAGETSRVLQCLDNSKMPDVAGGLGGLARAIFDIGSGHVTEAKSLAETSEAIKRTVDTLALCSKGLHIAMDTWKMRLGANLVWIGTAKAAWERKDSEGFGRAVGTLARGLVSATRDS